MRYLPHTASEEREMLKAVGCKSEDDLFSSIPQDLRLNRPLDLPTPLHEAELTKHLESLSKMNTDLSQETSFLGGGCYNHHIPAVVSELVTRSEFVTPYTPYQPEISQGTLQIIFEYQTLICRIFGMDISNASHYDGSTAAAEAALIATRITKKNKIIIPRNLHPEYRAVIETITRPSGTELIAIPFDGTGTINLSTLRDKIDDQTAGCIIQYPNFFGCIEDLKAIENIVHQKGALLITVTPEPISLGLIEAPGNLGTDIAVAEGHSFGCGMNFGGPHLGIFTAKEKYLRSMPGRIVGETVDAEGRRGYVLTFATREQHIRREKATSNICSNEALLAAVATIYLSTLGKEGFAHLANINFGLAEYAKKELTGITGVERAFKGATFNEFVIKLPKDADEVLDALKKKGIIGGIKLEKWYPELKNHLLVCVTEANEREEIERFAKELKACI